MNDFKSESKKQTQLCTLKQSLRKAQMLVHKYAKKQSLVKKLKLMRIKDARNDLN
ncbi:MAG: hypothetical protein JSS53_07415 [Proteobacteria bacterium]|nr:hypothetical protein [Pseudomonadota bacterium]